MNQHRLRLCARGAAILILAVPIAGAAVNRPLASADRGVLLKLELAHTAGDARALVPPGPRRDAVLLAQAADSHWFIPSYWALFLVSALAAFLTGEPRDRAAGIGVIVAITLAAAFDYRENAAIFSALTSAADGNGPEYWAVLKWILVFVATIGLGLPLLIDRGHNRTYARVTAVLLLIAGGLGVWAVLVDRSLISIASYALVPGLFLLALLFIWKPGHFIRTT